MTHITGKDINSKADAVALGNFDGLHRGHQALIHAARGVGRAAVFSFCPHPASVLNGVPFLALNTSEEKAALLGAMGVDLFIEYPFDKEMSEQTPGQFVRDVLVNRLCAKTIVVGEDYRFGSGGRGDCALLTDLGRALGFVVKIIPHVMDGGEKISSTSVRDAVSQADYTRAQRLMGRRYFVMGEVVHGNMIGRKMGIPTANLLPPPYKLLPPPGVSRTHVRLDGRDYVGMTNLGTRPTIADSAEVVLETHILGFDGDLYGKMISVEFDEWLRPEAKFHSVGELKNQLMRDRARCLQ